MSESFYLLFCFSILISVESIITSSGLCWARVGTCTKLVAEIVFNEVFKQVRLACPIKSE